MNAKILASLWCGNITRYYTHVYIHAPLVPLAVEEHDNKQIQKEERLSLIRQWLKHYTMLHQMQILRMNSKNLLLII